jgi:endonuclease YncB( thermonuclease family)
MGSLPVHAVLLLCPLSALLMSGCATTGDVPFAFSEVQEDAALDAWGYPNETGFVSRVTDGDTLRLRTGERIRLLGIDTPERGQPYWNDARQLLVDMVENRTVILERDLEDMDKYGRLLRYIYVGGRMVNEEMVRSGLASVYVIQPNGKYEPGLRKAEAAARSAGKGIWEPLCLESWSCEEWSECGPGGTRGRGCIDANACGTVQDKPPEAEACTYAGPPPSQPATEEGDQGAQAAPDESCRRCINLTALHWDAEGPDGSNKADEYAVFANVCGSLECSLMGWNVSDASANTYTFQSIGLLPGESVTLRSGKGNDTAADLYWCNHGYACIAIWSNDGDTLTLRDETGGLVLQYSY